MKKAVKPVSILLCIILAAICISACRGGSEESKGQGDTKKTQIRVWAPEEVVKITQTAVNDWLKGDGKEYSQKYTVTVSAMSEDNAATQMLTDVDAGADVYGFAQDQLARLVAAGALSPVGGDFLTKVKNENDAGSVNAATLEEKTYAYPETADNGYFMYYDKSVVTNTESLETILEDCAKANKKFYMNLQSGWYNISFFFGTGAEISYETDKEGKITQSNSSLATDNGLTALKAMIAFTSHQAYAQSENAAPKFNPVGGDAAVLVSGVWDSATVSGFLGDNFATAKLPQFTVDGKTYQMGSFGGYKLIGVKPQKDSDKLLFCHQLASFIAGEEMQSIRFKEKGWGPSNLKVQNSDEVKGNAALAALSAQLEYSIPQGQYPNEYWNIMEAFGTDLNSGKYNKYDDQQLRQVLKDLENDLKNAK